MSGHYIRRRLRLLLPLLFLGTGAVAHAQWGRISGQEKGDVVGRNITIIADLEEHDGIYEAYTGGDPDDSASSNVIEMLGPPTSEIVTNTMTTFKAASSAYRGAFRYPRSILNRNQRKTVVQLIRDMRDRTPAIGYVSSIPSYKKNYLTWTERDGNPAALSLIDIDTMRSDAVVEFAYAKNGFPIVRPNLFNTIINSPNLFEAITSSGNLLPSDQLYLMTPAIAVAPTVVVYDANDNPLSSGAASSMTAVNIYVYDEHSGPGGVQVFKDGSLAAASYIPMDDLDHIYDASDANLSILGSLTDGSYEIRAIDQAGNYTTSDFIISTSTPSADTRDDKDGSITDVIPSSRCIVIHTSDASAGIETISIEGPGLSKTFNFPCEGPAKSTDVYAGAFCNLVENSTYTYTVTSCSGKETTSSEITIATSTKGGRICVTSPAGTFCGGTGALSDTQISEYGINMRVCMYALSCGLCTITGWDNVTADPPGSAYCGTGPSCCRGISWGPPVSGKSFSVSNTTDVSNGDSGTYEFTIAKPGSEGQVSIAVLNSPDFKMEPGQGTSGIIDVAQIGQGYPTNSSDGVANIDSPFTRLHFSLWDLLEFLLGLSRQLLRASSSSGYGYFGSDAIFNSTTTLTFNYVDAVNTDTTTVRIYMFDGVSWSSAGITNQLISYSTTTQVITASGSVDRTGLYATLYQAQDSSAPITTFSIQGSTFSFDGALFVSTDSYVVLTATDPAVNGFASTVASVTYRIDPISDSPFYIYSSSIPLPLGTHVFEYRSLDYAGNAEVVKTATFTVTAGTALRTTNTAQVPGVLLNGFLGSGAKLEIESQAQNSLTLLISSSNRQALVSVDNIGQVGIGVAPQANLNIGADAIGLQLRSGNSTSSVTSAQIAFGYNGDSSMRHFMRTEHSTSTDGNKMDFLVWNTGAASTTTLAGLNVLSLQGIKTASDGSFHVQPVGEPDAEVEVSNGLTTGGGTMQRLDVVTPSSRRFKTNIKDLREKAEDRALADVVGLKHARFRYKSRQKGGRLFEDPAQPLRIGLIYEEAPESIREGKESLSTSERLVNVELALKATMRRLEELQKRYEKLKARRTTP